MADNVSKNCWDLFLTPAVQDDNNDTVRLAFQCDFAQKGLVVAFDKASDSLTPEFGTKILKAIFPICAECSRGGALLSDLSCESRFLTPTFEVSEADDGKFIDVIYKCDVANKMIALYYEVGVDTFEPELVARLGTTIFPICLECIRLNLWSDNGGNEC